MKFGAEKKGEVIALVVLLAIAAGLLWRSFAPASPAGAAAARVVVTETTPAGAPVPAPGAGALAGLARIDPTLDLKALERLRSVRYNGNGRNLFRFGPAPPTPAQRAAARQASEARRRASAAVAAPAGPPPPPPIPLRFYGYAQPRGGTEKIFLEMGNDNFVVSRGETIKHRYVIENIGKVSVQVKDLVTGSEQALPLIRGEN